MSAPRRSPGLPPPLGATLTTTGANFAVYAGHADSVELCLFDTDDPSGESERRIELRDRAYGTWFGSAPGVMEGQRYGYRVHGPWRPADGMRHNGAKLLLDPYARALDGAVGYDPALWAHTVDDQLYGDGEAPDGRDSKAFVPRGVVLDSDYAWDWDHAPHTPWSQTLIYEAHVRGLTMRHPDVPAELRGTYAGLAHPAVIGHLRSIGVTAVELLPVQVSASEPALVRQGLTNYWGYNTLGFFAPQPRYAAAGDPRGVLDEFRGMVKTLHAAGLEVLLDVVYNHTCELSGYSGPTLSWRGLDNRAYYRLDSRGQDVDVTGCGNTLDLRHPVVTRMVLDSLRYWVSECHVDGFRFDLAVALGRGRDDGYDPDHPFLVALRVDPVLSRIKLIAEPWDLGMHGWRTGQFPPPFLEWNDQFRDDVRSFWLGEAARATLGHPGRGPRPLATRLGGSEDLFGARDRGPLASVNYVAAHDGFTMADTTAYDHRHNQANGEDGHDGHGDNRSWNHGVEGSSNEEALNAARRRSIRNLMATVMVSSGVPMILAGDEMGRTQGGNNNAYCQDNPTSWLDWDLQPWQRDLIATTAVLRALRSRFPVLSQPTFFADRPTAADGTAHLAWYAADGAPMHRGYWDDPYNGTLVLFLDGSSSDSDSLLLAFHNGPAARQIVLPDLPSHVDYQPIWDSATEHPDAPASDSVPAGAATQVPARSVTIWRCRTKTAATSAGNPPPLTPRRESPAT